MENRRKTIQKGLFWFLKNSIPDNDYIYLRSNFQEMYKSILEEKSRSSANLWIWREILKSLPGFFSALLYWRYTMFKSYLKIALRNFRKHKMYAVLNIAGLAIGMACCILILLYIDIELSYDRYHKKADRIYRPVTKDFAGSPYLLGQKMLEDIPEVQNVARFRSISTFELPAFTFNNKSFREQGFYAVDPSVFEIFDIPFVYGDPKSSLTSPDSLVLTESTARKYFGPVNPLGKTLMYEDKLDFTVTGVIKDLPDNSHLTFDILVSPSAIEDLSGRDDRFNWSSGNYRTYLLLKNGVNPNIVEDKQAGILSNVEPPGLFKDTSYVLQPLTSIHLHSHLRGEFKENGNIRDIYLYSTIGLIILIMACINFINLASAHSLNRSLEIGVRKVLGATKKQVIRQFIGESVLFAWLALPIALLLVRYFLSFFNNQINSQISLTQLNSILILGILVGLTSLVGVLAGSYPAFFSSSFSPLKGLKREDSTGMKKFSLRNTLIMVQFAISAVFICCTLIVVGQMNFMKKKDLGIQTDHIINVPISKTVSLKALLMKEEFLKHPDVKSVAISNFLPSHAQTIHMGGEWEGRTEDDIETFRYLYVDFDFIETFDIQLLEGRNFSKVIQTDKGGAYILNEAAVKAIGWQNPLGKMFKIDGVVDYFGSVIGVVKDFHFRSLHHTIDPMVLFISPDHPKWLFFSSTNFSVKTSGQNLPGLIRYLEDSFKKYTPYQPFEFYFFDEDFDKAYKAEQERGQLYRFFATISILIACLGLYGLASFTSQQRTKEIGIRKVMGASIPQIVFLLTKESTKWILLANLIAWPAAYFIMHRWLQIFAYRINIHIGFFILSAVLTLFISWLTSSYQSIKASLADPVHSLRYE